MSNALRRVQGLGQSIWLDYIHRDLIASGRLRRLIEEDALSGMTSNPSIFEKAIAEGNSYDDEILSLSSEGADARRIYDELSRHDVGAAADEFRSVYEATRGDDGFVSLEVDPHLAEDTAGSIAEARRLWSALQRPNVMIKIPATRAGLPAIRQLISEGINVNVTLLFSLSRYRDVIEAYVAGIQARADASLPIAQVCSVASFFVSRIDSLIDPMLDRLIAVGGERAAQAKAMRGRTAIASARLASQMHAHVFAHERFKALHARGARVQRLLWASTSAKDPLFSDIKYVEALMGPGTIDTMPLETLEAYRDHGEPQVRLGNDLAEARWVLENLPALGIDLDAATAQLEREGVQKFVAPFDKLLRSITGKQAGASRAASAAGGTAATAAGAAAAAGAARGADLAH
jgi:transaldolase